ncbi:SA1362 family protein [Ectobacillus ponti]|uniref:Uncharacterized protein n=1 Tax=Ectobacillus ponti TaxID=2961894 RepID=A0AA41X4K3_9BACI|nr:SA1362 family protein [Ectobacillus ponti]MCP8967068.1 hypothetical protein [Ectobacillus ponti]
MNGRSLTFVLFVVVMGLAAFQFVSYLITNPGKLLGNLLTIGIVLGAFYWLYRLFSNSGSSADTRASYNRAAKQSKRKYAKQNVTPLSIKRAAESKLRKSSAAGLKKKRKSTHLTVIEGKKSKKKNRASF